MEIGVYHEFHCRPDQTAAAAYEEALGQIEAADRWGLDAIWLAEIHQQARRSAQQREHYALHQQLSSDSRRARAQRRST